MKTQLIYYTLAGLLLFPALPSEAQPAPEKSRTELSATSFIGKKKPKKAKKAKRKHIYRPGARQN